MARTGEPVCIRPISNDESFRGFIGFEGAFIYAAKDIDRHAASRVIKRRLGRLVGASGQVAGLLRDRPNGMALPEPQPKWLTGGGGGLYFVEATHAPASAGEGLL